MQLLHNNTNSPEETSCKATIKKKLTDLQINVTSCVMRYCPKDGPSILEAKIIAKLQVVSYEMALQVKIFRKDSGAMVTTTISWYCVSNRRGRRAP